MGFETFELWQDSGEWRAPAACDVGWRDPLPVDVVGTGIGEEPSPELTSLVREILTAWRGLWPGIVEEVSAMTGLEGWKVGAKVESTTVTVAEESRRWSVQLTLHGSRHAGTGYFVDFDGLELVGSSAAD